MKILMITFVAALLFGCSDADIASSNLSKAAEQFELYRRVVFFNGITDKYILQIEGACSIEDRNRQLEVTCKRHDGKFVKHHLGLSDNVSYFSEQMTNANVSTLRHRVIFKPVSIVPDVDLILK
jgi:hypothetical protein